MINIIGKVNEENDEKKKKIKRKRKVVESPGNRKVKIDD